MNWLRLIYHEKLLVQNYKKIFYFFFFKGFVTSGFYSYKLSKGAGIGYISNELLSF